MSFTPDPSAPFQPEPSPNLAKQAQEQGRVRDQPRGNYIWGYHPDDWQQDGEGNLFPVLTHLSKEAGNGGVDKDGSFERAEIQYRKRGIVLIPHEALAEGTDYVVPYRNRRGKVVHRNILQTPYMDQGVTKWAFDDEGRKLVIQALRKAGYIKPPKPHVLRGMLELAQGALGQLRIPRSEDSLAMERYDDSKNRLQRQIAKLEEELAASVEVYGEQHSPARGLASNLLQRLKEEAEAEEAAAAPKKGAKRGS